MNLVPPVFEWKRARRALAGLALALLILPSPAWSQCSISGPAVADVNQDFTLCGPRGVGDEWEWVGPGINGVARSRCITIDGRGAGTLRYELVIRDNGREIERCTHAVVVGGGGGGTGSLNCDIRGGNSIPAGGSVQLCGPSSSLHSYEWTTPSGQRVSGRCITAREAGTYSLVIRNVLTGSIRECSHVLSGEGSSSGAGCDISGASTVARGGSVRWCGPSNADYTYRWTGPQGYAATARCVTLSVPGSYTLTVRNRYTGATDVCTQRLVLDTDADDDGVNDADEVVGDNCPRALGFWMQQTSGGTRTGNPNELASSSIATLAACMDNRSSAFSWSNDLDGFMRALRPARPLTRRAVLTREYAVLLANLCAGERNLTDRRGRPVGLDPDTVPDDGQGISVATLATRVDRMLVTGRGNFATMTRRLQAINSGRNIPSSCD